MNNEPFAKIARIGWTIHYPIQIGRGKKHRAKAGMIFCESETVARRLETELPESVAAIELHEYVASEPMLA